MKTFTLLPLLLATLVLAEPTTQPAYRDYGEGLKLPDEQTIDAAKVLAAPAEYDGKQVRLRGKIAQVCQHSGCWMELGVDGSTTRLLVQFTCPVEGRLIPADSAGREAIVEGTVKVREIDEDTARHYAKDAGATDEQIQQIKGPQKQVRLASPAARVMG